MSVTLAEIILDFRPGFASGKSDDAGYVQVRMNNIDTDGGLSFNTIRRVPRADTNLSRFKVEQGDILFNATNSPELVGKSALFRGFHEPVVYSNHFLRLRLDLRRACPGYVSRWLQMQRSQGIFTQMCKQWVNQATVEPKRLMALAIPLPPLPEQRRIAAILDQADALRAKRRATLAQLDEMAQAIFVEMFGDLRHLSGNPCLRRVSDYVSHFQGGKSIDADIENRDACFRVLKVSAVTNLGFRPAESKPLPATYVPPPSHFVRKGDLLFSRANTTELVGAVTYLDDAPADVTLPDKIWRFVWKDQKSVQPLFVETMFRMPAVREEIGRRATGTSGSMKNISQQKLMDIETILPEIDQQTRFSNRLTAARTCLRLQQRSVRHIGALFASLQHRAFTGAL